jgi:hypothetical protein
MSEQPASAPDLLGFAPPLAGAPSSQRAGLLSSPAMPPVLAAGAYVPPYRLTFPLPTSLAFSVSRGVHHPCLAGCLLRIERGGMVHIDGPSRELVFDQAARFFRVIAKVRRALVIAATLLSPGRGCRDGWTITVNADVSFAPTGLGVDCPISLLIGQPGDELLDTGDELSDIDADG